MTDENNASGEQPLSNANLDDVFSGNDGESVQVEAKPTKVAVQKSEPQGEVEEDAETPTAKDNEGPSVPVAALKDERRKRQELEARLAELEARENGVKPPARPDVLEDQEGAFKHTETIFEERLFQERINLTKEAMMESKPDYLEKADYFLELVKEHPALGEEIRKVSNPAKFAYTKAKEHLDYLEFQKTKDSEEWKSFQEAKKAGKLTALVETPEQKRNKSALSAPNLSRATAVGSNTVQKLAVPTLDELFED